MLLSLSSGSSSCHGLDHDRHVLQSITPGGGREDAQVLHEMTTLSIGCSSPSAPCRWCTRTSVRYSALRALLASCRAGAGECAERAAASTAMPAHALPAAHRRGAAGGRQVRRVFGCMTCVSRCPAPGALDMTVKTGRRRLLRPVHYVLLLVAFLSRPHRRADGQLALQDPTRPTGLVPRSPSSPTVMKQERLTA